jgi:hypothetical protein
MCSQATTTAPTGPTAGPCAVLQNFKIEIKV